MPGHGGYEESDIKRRDEKGKILCYNGRVIGIVYEIYRVFIGCYSLNYGAILIIENFLIRL